MFHVCYLLYSCDSRGHLEMSCVSSNSGPGWRSWKVDSEGTGHWSVQKKHLLTVISMWRHRERFEFTIGGGIFCTVLIHSTHIVCRLSSLIVIKCLLLRKWVNETIRHPTDQIALSATFFITLVCIHTYTYMYIWIYKRHTLWLTGKLQERIFV